MSVLIALAGFSGAGKTTAVEHLVKSGLGKNVYLGSYVLLEVQARGLPPTRENERLVRLELRTQYGPGILMQRALPEISILREHGENVLLDAVFEPEEFSLLVSRWKTRTHLVGIDASFETRSARLARRDQRPYSAAELCERDKTETARLKTQAVLESSAYRIRNEGAIEDFRRALLDVWSQLV